MFAVVQTGGKQYRVTENDTILVEKLEGEAGSTVALDSVLMIGEDGKAPTVGAPLIEKAAVFAEVVDQTRGDKVIVFKKKRRQNYRRKKGHRQDLTVLKITSISADGKKPAAAKKAAPKKEVAAEEKEAPAKKAAAKTETAKKAPAKKAAAPKKETAAKKAPAKKAPAKKPAAKKADAEDK